MQLSGMRGRKLREMRRRGEETSESSAEAGNRHWGVGSGEWGGRDVSDRLIVAVEMPQPL